MSEKEIEEKVEMSLKEILRTLRIAATATAEVSEEKNLAAVEEILKRNLRDLGVEE